MDPREFIVDAPKGLLTVCMLTSITDVFLSDHIISNDSTVIIGNTYINSIVPKRFARKRLRDVLSFPATLPIDEHIDRVLNLEYKKLSSLKDQILYKMLYSVGIYDLVIFSDYALAETTVSRLSSIAANFANIFDKAIIMYRCRVDA